MPSLTKIQTGFLEPQGAFELTPGTAGSPGLFFSGNTSTGMFSPSAGVLGFSTGSTQQALTILANGNVGIGTNSPVRKLDVHSGNSSDVVQFTNDSGTTLTFGATSGMTTLDAPSSTGFRFRSGGSSGQHFTISSSGNVGIGTDNPLAKLNVNGAGLFLGNVKVDDYISHRSNQNILVKFYNTGVNSTSYVGLSADDNAGGNTFKVYGQGSNTERMRIASSGNVGIGTNSPDTRLHIEDSWTVGASTNDIFTVARAGDAVKFVVGYDAVETDMYLGTNTNHTLQIRTNNSAQVTVTNVGNVGIGTDNPLTKLDTRGALHVGGGSNGIWLGNAGDNTAYDNVKLYYTGYNSGSPRVYLTPRTQPGSGTVNTFLHLQSNSGLGVNNMGLIVDGNVGIGTNNPDVKLYVSGTGVSGQLVPVLKVSNSSYSTFGGPAIDFAPDSTTYTYWLTGRIGSYYDGVTSWGGGLRFLYNNGTTSSTLSEGMILNTSGNVGIGTTNPVAKLDVVGNIKASTNIAVVNSSSFYVPFSLADLGAGTDEKYWRFTLDRTSKSLSIGTQNDASSAAYSAIGITRTGTNVENVIFYTLQNNERARITSSGNVGIGTTNPQSKIHVNAESGTVSTGASVGVIGRRLSFNNSTSDTYGALNIGDWNTLGQRVIVSISSRQSGGTGDQYYENGGAIATLRFTGSGTDSATGMVASEITANSSGSGFGNTNTSPSDLIFRVSGSGGTRTVPVERLRITGSGNVGIGTANPSEKLSVDGTISIRNTTSGDFRIYRLDHTSTPRASARIDSAGGYPGGNYISFNSYKSGFSDYEIARFYGNNEVSPTRRLTIGVNGEIIVPEVYSDTVGATNRDLYVDDTGKLGYVSSIRASKANINIISSVDWLYQLEPVSFNRRKQDENENYIDETYDELEYGLIAEDVEVVAPEICFYDIVDDTKELKGIHYSKLITPLLKAIKDLKSEVELLKSQLNP